MELWQRSASELLDLMEAGEVSAREVLDAHLARIDAANDAVNAVVTLAADRAHEEAAAIDEARAHGTPVGPLAGLPLTVKDTYETAGVRTTVGAADLAGHVPERDAVAVGRLRAAGAILLGKTNVPTWAVDLQTTNDLFGTTTNPWAPDRTPGGSSGGAAAAVALGMTPVELGSDTAGSIRIPAHYCGVAGHRPTWGLVPTRGHIPPPPGARTEPDLTVSGPLARTVGDLEVLLDAVAGPVAPHDRAWHLRLPPPAVQRPEHLRVAVWLDDATSPTQRAYGAVLETVVDDLAEAGVEVVELAPPDELPRLRQLFTVLMHGTFAGGYPPRVFDRLLEVAAAAPDEDRSALEELAAAVTQTHRDWQHHHEWRLQVAAAWEQRFEDVHAVLTPVTPTLAVPHNTEGSQAEREIEVDGIARPYFDQLAWIGLAGAPGLPATVVPVGVAPADEASSRPALPAGLQVIGPAYGDRTTLAVAGILEGVTGGFRWPPAAG